VALVLFLELFDFQKEEEPDGEGERVDVGDAGAQEQEDLFRRLVNLVSLPMTRPLSKRTKPITGLSK
jgi:hypothetical protein